MRGEIILKGRRKGERGKRKGKKRRKGEGELN